MDALSYFKDKKITVMGLGLLGGVGDIQFLAESYADIIATDLKNEEELRPSLEKLKKFSNIRYTVGKHDLSDFKGRDLVIKAPGTPLDSPYIAEARKEGTEVSMWAALFARFAREKGATIVGVTGTRGKTTVTAMIAAILRAGDKKVVEGGNVQGTSVLPQLAQITSNTIAVLELDSWKLQGFEEAKMSPDIAVFTTFYDDHLNYYKGDRNAYFADKANIFLYQTPRDTLIMGKQCAPLIIDKYGDKIESKTLVVDETKLPDTWTLRIPGLHNRYNAALALAAARALKIPDDTSREALTTFKGVPGRLEFVREVKGIQIYNDTTSTTPEATIAALRALDPEKKKNVILVMGGSDKGLDMSALWTEILVRAKDLYFLAGTGTDRIRSEAPHVPIYNSLQEVIGAAMAGADPGDVLLFSPAFTSFGMFKNEYDRGDQFNAIIKEL